MIAAESAMLNLDFEATFAEQHRRSRSGPPPSLAERRARLCELERAIVAHRPAIAAAAYADFGRCPTETEFSETVFTLAELKAARANLATWMKPQRVPSSPAMFGSRAELRYEPKGVALIVSPWNYPFQLAMCPLVAALAAGNRAIVRPSEKAPHMRAVIAAIVAQAFAPHDVAVVGGEVETAQALLRLPFDHIFFTGSTAIGKIVMRAAAEHLASVTLELGGKSPVIVAPDADVRWAAKRVAWGKFVNAGQTCIAPDYVLVHESLATRFTEAVVDAVAAMYGRTEALRAATPDFCRLVDDAHLERVAALIDAAVRAGATLETGGEVRRAERYVAPTVFSDVGFDGPLMREEIFGPVLPILRYRSLDDALREIGARPKPLALYTFTRSEATLERILQTTRAGATVNNDTLVHWAHPHLPAGGVGDSGLGSYHGRFGFEAFSHRRPVLRQSTRSLVPLLAPPYTRISRAMLRVLESIS